MIISNIDTNGTGQATLTNGVITCTANSPEDSVNIRYNQGINLSDPSGGLLFDIKGQGVIDVKFYSDKTYWVQQIPFSDTIEIDLQGIAAHLDIKKVYIIKISVYTPGVYTISNLRFGRLDIPVEQKIPKKSNLIPNGQFEFGLTGFTFYAGAGKFNQRVTTGRSGYCFKFELISPDSQGNAGAFIYSGYIDLKKGNYEFSTWFKSDSPGKYRWFITNEDGSLSGQYWLDQTVSKGNWEESTAKFTANKDTRVRVYFSTYSPVNFYVDEIRISPQKQQVQLQGNQFILNGKAEHLIGVYHGSKENVAYVGFRHHKPDFFPTQSDVDFYIKNGIYLWADISGMMRTHLLDSIQDIESLYTQSNLVINYNDEPDHIEQNSSPAFVRKASQLLQNINSIPLLNVVMSWYQDSCGVFQYQDSGQIIGTDLYTRANNKDYIWLTNKIKDFLKVKADKPRIVVVEAGDFLSFEEQRVQAWLPISCGADGVVFWTLDDIKTQVGLDNLKKVVTELNQYNFLTGIGVPLDANVPCVIKFQEQQYIVGCNNNNYSVKVNINKKFSNIKPILNATDLIIGDVLTFSSNSYEPFILQIINS